MTEDRARTGQFDGAAMLSAAIAAGGALSYALGRFFDIVFLQRIGLDRITFAADINLTLVVGGTLLAMTFCLVGVCRIAAQIALQRYRWFRRIRVWWGVTRPLERPLLDRVHGAAVRALLLVCLGLVLAGVSGELVARRRTAQVAAGCDDCRTYETARGERRGFTVAANAERLAILTAPGRIELFSWSDVRTIAEAPRKKAGPKTPATVPTAPATASPRRDAKGRPVEPQYGAR